MQKNRVPRPNCKWHVELWADPVYIFRALRLEIPWIWPPGIIPNFLAIFLQYYCDISNMINNMSAPILKTMIIIGKNKGTIYLLGAKYNSQSPSVSASASKYSAGRKVLFDFCVSSYIYQSTPALSSDIHPHLNITRLYRIRTSEGSLNGNNFLVFSSIFCI